MKQHKEARVKTFSLPAVLAAVGTSFAVGFAVAWNLFGSGANADAEQQVAASTPGQPGANPVADLWNKAGPAVGSLPSSPAPNSAQPVADGAGDEQRLREQALADPVFLRNLIHRYETEPSPEKKDMIRSVLATIPKPEVLAFFSRLASSNDAAQRKEGYTMLQQMGPNSPEMLSVLKQALTNEQSPEALAQAIAALRPMPMDPSESQGIVGQLRTLAHHPDAAVRSQSILQLAQWDKNGQQHDQLAQAMTDPSAEVRQSAIFAIGQSGARDDSLKTALLGIVQNPNENRDVKGSALQVLERFSLNKEEYASYMQARSQIGF